MDHAGGFIDVIDRYRVNAFYKSGADGTTQIYTLLTSKIADKKLSAKNLSRSDSLKDSSGTSLKILSPRPRKLRKVDQNRPDSDLNALSLVALLSFGNFSALLTGDAEAEVLEDIAEEVGLVSVLKVSHHGSAGGVSDMILNQIQPHIAIISAGKNNRFGHPAKETLDILEKHGIGILRTDQDGEIEMVSDGKIYSVGTK